MNAREAIILFIVTLAAVTIGNLIALKIAGDQISGSLNATPTGRLLGALAGN